MRGILKDFPDSFETERLLIRSVMPGDGKAVNAAILETIEDLQYWMLWANPIPGVDDTEEVVRKGRAKFLAREDLPMLLFLKGTDTLVGGSGLHRPDWNIPKLEIGYWCRKQFQGQGLISEAAQGLTDFGFRVLGARRIEIRCDEKNVKSKNVAERLGFRLEGCLVNEGLNVQGQLRNTLVYAKTQ